MSANLSLIGLITNEDIQTAAKTFGDPVEDFQRVLETNPLIGQVAGEIIDLKKLEGWDRYGLLEGITRGYSILETAFQRKRALVPTISPISLDILSLGIRNDGDKEFDSVLQRIKSENKPLYDFSNSLGEKVGPYYPRGVSVSYSLIDSEMRFRSAFLEN